MFSFLISTPFQLKRFSQPLEEETSRVFMLRNEVQDVQVLSGHVYRESAQTAHALWDGGDFGIGNRVGRMVSASVSFYLNFVPAKNMAPCPLK